MIPLAALKGVSLGDTVYRTVFAALVIAVLGAILFAFTLGRFGMWRADVWKGRAQEAGAAAQQAQANAASANAGAANATTTRQNMDAGTFTLRVETEAAAQRIEGYANRPAPVADLSPVDPDVVRELEAAEDRARAAADRLQRKHPR